jgi:O-antigen/teichoic acid export membrane protein
LNVTKGSRGEPFVTRVVGGPRRIASRPTSALSLPRLLRSRASPVAASRIVAAGLAAVVVLLTSAVLSPAGRGELAALQAAALLLAAAGGGSLSLGVSIVVGKDATAAGRATALALAASTLLAAVLTPLAAALAGTLGVSTSAAVVTALVAATVAGYGTLQGLPIGLGRMLPYAFGEGARAVTSLTAIGVGLAAGVRSPGALLALWGAGPLAGVVPLVRQAAGRSGGPPLRAVGREAVRRSLRAHPTNLAGLAVARLDIVVLAAVSSRSQVAYYSLAIVMAEAAWLLPSAFAVTTLSDFVRLPGQKAWRAARRALPSVVAAAGASGVVAGAGGVLAIVLLLPDGYHASVAPLWIAIAGMVPYSVGHVVSPYLVTAVNRPALATGIAAVTLVVDLALVVVLGGPHGALGAAIASTVAYTAHAALNLRVLRREGGRAPAR